MGGSSRRSAAWLVCRKARLKGQRSFRKIAQFTVAVDENRHLRRDRWHLFSHKGMNSNLIVIAIGEMHSIFGSIWSDRRAFVESIFGVLDQSPRWSRQEVGSDIVLLQLLLSR